MNYSNRRCDWQYVIDENQEQNKFKCNKSQFLQIYDYFSAFFIQQQIDF